MSKKTSDSSDENFPENVDRKLLIKLLDALLREQDLIPPAARAINAEKEDA
ncbi:MAG: hypothetical protein HYW49_13460 [Deltaproteobacteria bacterium]|nr:hypothetical protein [Deltaproteobacteria bacterium]